MSDSNIFFQSVAVNHSAGKTSITERIASILKRQIEARCNAKVIFDDNAEYEIELCVVSSIGKEAFQMKRKKDAHVVITGGDERGLLYGVGKFLRSSGYCDKGFCPGDWNGTSSPEKSFRCIYFATHFHNFYHDAPLNVVVEYLEDLALWGYNTLMVWYDMHHYKSVDDPDARKMQQRLKNILGAAKAIGLDVCLGGLGNEAYADSPEELRADYNTGRATYDVELCPNKPGATELMLRWFDEELDVFAEIEPDYFAFGPYDQGGCACEKCKPWGANGFLKIAEEKAILAKKRFVQSKVILMTWLFDYGRDQGEWGGLAKAFMKKPNWCDYILADSHATYPEFPIKKGVPGKLPLLNFPEISMWEMHPWGGFGANPLPSRFESLWQNVKNHIEGGMPYSEGIYEDMNKVLYAQFYWDSNRTAEDIIKEYTAFEFSPNVLEEVINAVRILEKNHGRIWSIDWKSGYQIRMEKIRKDAGAAEASQILDQVQAQLSLEAKSSWRWRILYLRALIDYELSKTKGFWANENCEKAFRELNEIYYAQQAEYKCAAPSRESLETLRTSEFDVI